MNRSRLKPSKIAILALLFALGIPFAAYAEKAVATKTVEMEIPTGKLQAIDVETTNGSIILSASSKDKIELLAEITVKGLKKSTCEELLDEVELKIKEDEETLKIEAKIPKKFRYSFSVSYELKVPKNFSADLASVNGHINASGLMNGVSIETVNGEISCEEITGAIYAETVNGAIDLKNILGNISAQAVNGSIEVACAKTPPRNLAAETVNGDIDIILKQIPNVKLQAETMNGSITIGNEKIKKNSIIGHNFDDSLGNGEGKWSLETVNGSISVEFPK